MEGQKNPEQRLNEMFGSEEAELTRLNNELPQMRHELQELQDRELSLMNKLDLDRMTTLERQIPSFEERQQELEKRLMDKNGIQDFTDSIN